MNNRTYGSMVEYRFCKPKIRVRFPIGAYVFERKGERE